MTGEYNTQQDSQEFLEKILDNFKDLNLNIVDSFKFTESSTLKSNGNPNRQKNEEKFFLELSINNDSKNIQNIINNEFKEENLNKNKYIHKEEGKNNIVYNKKILSISSLNKYVFIQLKRFVYNKKTMTTIRLNNSIEINYNITFQVGTENKTYKLIGVICHLGGSVNNGHYIYYKFTNKDNVVIFNDSTIKKYGYNNDTNTKVKSFIQSNCYVLMYEEVDHVAKPEANPEADPEANIKNKKVAKPEETKEEKLKKNIKNLIDNVNKLNSKPSEKNKQISNKIKDFLKKNPSIINSNKAKLEIALNTLNKKNKLYKNMLVKKLEKNLQSK
jgi:hypothetical protein